MKANTNAVFRSRRQIVDRVMRELERRSYPRLQMMLLVALTGGAGFLASVALLALGVDALALRYLLAVALAYLVFLLLLWVWLRVGTEDYDGLDDVAFEVLDAFPSATSRAAPYAGGGGRFGGGGSSAQWDSSAMAQDEPLVEWPQVPVPQIADVAGGDSAHDRAIRDHCAARVARRLGLVDLRARSANAR